MERTGFIRQLLALCLAFALVITATGTMALAEETPELRTVHILFQDIDDPNNPLSERDQKISQQVFDAELAKRGVKIEYEYLDRASIADVVRTRMAAQVEVPDMIADSWIGITENEILTWAQDGLLYNIKDLVNQYDDDGSIFKFYEDHCPGILGTVTAADGGIYWFSYLSALEYVHDDGTPLDYQGSPFAVLVRKDWLEKANVEYKKQMTHQELFDALKAIQDADANGNGEADEVVAIAINNFVNGIARSFGLSTQILCAVDAETNKVYNNVNRPEFVDYIKYMQSLYEAGLYDTTALGSGMIDELIADNKASLAYNYAAYSVYETTVSAVDDAYYTPIMLMNDDGKAYASVDPTSIAYCHYMVTKACKDPEAVIDLMDYIYTDEYAMLDVFGVEGVGYEYNEYGVPIHLFDSKVHPANWEGLELNWTVGQRCVPRINTVKQQFKVSPQNDYEHLKEEYAVWFQEEGGKEAIKEEATLQLALPSDEEMERTSEIDNTLATYESELLTDLILGRRSLDNLQEYIDEMESLGLSEYMQIMQARRDRFTEAMANN